MKKGENNMLNQNKIERDSVKMKKVLVVLLGGLMLTGCGNSKKNTNTNVNNNSNNNSNIESSEKTVVKNQIFEGLEFVNVGVNNGVIKTIVINNTGYVYEGSKFKMTIMNENGEVILEQVDEVKESMEAGTTKEIETKTNVDLSNAASIEYSIVTE